MFSGIIEKKATIIDYKNGRFTVENIFGSEVKIGQSIAHDGACMTIENADRDSYSFFSMKETLDKTNFGRKKVGDYFNIERSIKIGERLDGHFVSGHIDCTGEIIKIDDYSDSSKVLHVRFPDKYNKYIIEKGSVAVNGVSLTVVEVLDNSCTISIIPLTQEITNIGNLNIGEQVNLEFDMLGKYIEKITVK